VEDVFIVGGGASGLFCACELARQGVRARVVDRESEPHHQARATAIEPATLETFARAGVINEFLRFAVHVHQSRVCGPGSLTLAQSSFAGLDCAYEFQCCLPQWRTEEILLRTVLCHRLGRQRTSAGGIGRSCTTPILRVALSRPAGARYRPADAIAGAVWLSPISATRAPTT
jgi:2-polyprenyl-6-methoxyphenol hydroxylase-like FAD-dependent oxidoreductase